MESLLISAEQDRTHTIVAGIAEDALCRRANQILCPQLPEAVTLAELLKYTKIRCAHN